MCDFVCGTGARETVWLLVPLVAGLKCCCCRAEVIDQKMTDSVKEDR